MNIFSKTLKVLTMVGAFSFLLASCGYGDGNSGNDVTTPPPPPQSTEWTILYSTEYGTAPASKKVADGYKLTAADLPTLSNEGYEFKGWYTEEDFSRTAISGWGAGEKTADVELYAKWEAPVVLKSQSNWFDETKAGVEKRTITKITFQKAAYTGSSSANWDAGVNAGEITAYLNGTEIIVSSNGKDMMANDNSSYMFASYNPSFFNDGFINSIEIDISCIDTSKVINMECMFLDCKALTNLDVSNFNTSNVTNMTGMFYWCSTLEKIYVTSSNFNVSNVTSADGMFALCSRLTSGSAGGLTAYDPSKVDKTYATVVGGYFTEK